MCMSKKNFFPAVTYITFTTQVKVFFCFACNFVGKGLLVAQVTRFFFICCTFTAQFLSFM